MNYHYLIKHISYHLHTIVRHYAPDGTLTESYCARVAFQDVFSDEEIYRVINEYSSPAILWVNDAFAYALVRTGTSCFVIGPVGFSEPVRFNKCHYMDQDDKSWLESVPICSFDEFSGDILLVHNLCHTDEITSEGLHLANCIDSGTDEKIQESFSQIVFRNRELGKTHNPYDQEIREFSSIETGDPEQLKRSLAEDYTGEIGTLADHPLRQAKNRAIVVVTLASRAAIRGGIQPEAAYSLSDSYIQKIEKCRDIPSVFHLFHAAEYEYAQMVKELNEQKEGILSKDKNPHINKCKDYIFSHLHEKIVVRDIADTLGLNAGYLSELFHTCEKITLTNYIRREKVRLAENLLIYSRYSYSEIATYLGFSSQSHLGKYFREATGMTMRQYRSIYGVRAFDTEKPQSRLH
ncbi:AraC family transcriptional regulator [Ruminococcus sp. CLA-AA-H200]|uniref:AraC family transcriptional regulator n=1 Tax=Ruminococcus turbiniformis TaxID=2881258 RepID=A0ABS8FW23_9FIRM|nr:AraC family transcriptional regulator [Ruminococcus turbiniformis]MCC2254230.1 AraC family transcriptional regulator [Ruminococcus turbiniformis]